MLDESKRLSCAKLLILMMDGTRNLYFDSPNLCLLRLFICLSALACEWGRGGSCELSCAREKLACRLEGRPGCWLWLDCFAFQRMSAERGNEGCGMMTGLEQGDGTSTVRRVDPLPQLRAVLYWLAMPCHSYCSLLVRQSISCHLWYSISSTCPQRDYRWGQLFGCPRSHWEIFQHPNSEGLERSHPANNSRNTNKTKTQKLNGLCLLESLCWVYSVYCPHTAL